MAKNILICDDAAFMRMMIKDILTKNGYNVVGEAENGLKAVEKYSETKPDLVLMDMKMPVMDGRTATSEIRKFNAEIPIIALTAHAFDADRVAALKAGCDDYLVKPINGAKLMQTLKEYGC